MTSAEFFQILLPFLLSPYQYKRPHNLPSFGKILGTTSLLLVPSAKQTSLDHGPLQDGRETNCPKPIYFHIASESV